MKTRNTELPMVVICLILLFFFFLRNNKQIPVETKILRYRTDGDSAFAQRNYEEARSHFQHALSLIESTGRGKDLEFRIRQRLADCYQELRYADLAIAQYEMTIDLLKHSRKTEDRRSIAAVYVKLAEVHGIAKHHRQAIDKAKDATEILESLPPGPEDLEMLASLYNDITWHLILSSRLVEAEKAAETGLHFAKKTFPNTGIFLSRARSNFGFRYESKMQYEKGLEHRRMAVAEADRILGRNQNFTIQRYFNLASSYMFSGRPTKAQEIAKMALAEARRVNGDNHWMTLQGGICLANSYKFARQFQEAEKVYQAALDLSIRLYGTDHPETDRIRALLQKNNENGLALTAEQGPD